MTRSPFIFFVSLAALVLAASLVWFWGMRPEPTVMLFIGAALAICASAARRRNRAEAIPVVGNFGVFRS